MKQVVGFFAVAATMLALPSLTAGVVCKGGDTKVIDGYAIHTFTNSGTIVVAGSGKVEVLVVGGGGGGGMHQHAGGGGGGGGVVTQELTVVAGEYPVVVGAA